MAKTLNFSFFFLSSSVKKCHQWLNLHMQSVINWIGKWSPRNSKSFHRRIYGTCNVQIFPVFFQLQYYLCSKMHYVFFFLQIANTGIKRKRGEKKKREGDIIQLKLNFFGGLACFLLKILTLPYQPAWLMAVLLCSLFWHLAHIKMLWECTMISHFTETSDIVERLKQEVGYKKIHV